MKSHMKLLEFIIEFSEKKKQRKLANETSKNDLTIEGMKTHIVKSTYQIRKNGEEKRSLSEEKYYKWVYYSPELHHPRKQG